MPIDLPLCRGRDEGLARDSNKRMMATGRFWPLADFRERPLQANSFAEHWRSNKPASSCNYELGA